jgi:regulator of RNase E activity RraA
VKLTLERQLCGPTCTIGELLVDGAYECFTLEDTVRDVKIAGETAIPYGTYNVTITYSNRFKRDLPLVENVPNFTGVRIHPGNTAEDTEGCILVGRGKTDKTVTESKAAFNALFKKLQEALDEGDTISLEIV